MNIHYDVEFCLSNNYWRSINTTIGGMSKGFASQDEAQSFIDNTVPLLAKSDYFYRGAKWRILKYTKEIVE